MEIIVENLRENGVMMLQNFLKPSIYAKIAQELKSSGISWCIKGPANRRYSKIHRLIALFVLNFNRNMINIFDDKKP